MIFQSEDQFKKKIFIHNLNFKILQRKKFLAFYFIVKTKKQETTHIN
jgi:hypothetical protein